MSLIYRHKKTTSKVVTCGLMQKLKSHLMSVFRLVALIDSLPKLYSFLRAGNTTNRVPFVYLLNYRHKKTTTRVAIAVWRTNRHTRLIVPVFV